MRWTTMPFPPPGKQLCSCWDLHRLLNYKVPCGPKLWRLPCKSWRAPLTTNMCMLKDILLKVSVEVGNFLGTSLLWILTPLLVDFVVESWKWKNAPIPSLWLRHLPVSVATIMIKGLGRFIIYQPAVELLRSWLNPSHNRYLSVAVAVLVQIHQCHPFHRSYGTTLAFLCV